MLYSITVVRTEGCIFQSCNENPPIKAVLQIEGALRCSSSMLARPATASLFNSFNTEPPAVNFDSAIMAALGNVTMAVTVLLLLPRGREEPTGFCFY